MPSAQWQWLLLHILARSVLLWLSRGAAFILVSKSTRLPPFSCLSLRLLHRLPPEVGVSPSDLRIPCGIASKITILICTVQATIVNVHLCLWKTWWGSMEPLHLSVLSFSYQWFLTLISFAISIYLTLDAWTILTIPVKNYISKLISWHFKTSLEWRWKPDLCDIFC